MAAHKDRGGGKQTAADASVPKKRKPGRPKGTPASAKQKATNVGARAAAAKAREARKKERELERQRNEKPRWKKLEDGDITLKDLDLKELVRKQVTNNDGSWEGRRHEFSPRWQQRMHTEFRRRFRQNYDELAPMALEAIEDILQDEDNPAQRWAAAKTMIEYQMGKVPEVVHVGAETEYDRLSQTAFVIMRGRDHVAVDDEDEGALDQSGHEVVRGELA